MEQLKAALTILILAVLLLGGAFYAGREYTLRTMDVAETITEVVHDTVRVPVVEIRTVGVPYADPRLVERVDSLTTELGGKDSVIAYLASPFRSMETGDNYVAEIAVDPIDKIISARVEIAPIVVEKVVYKTVEVQIDDPWYSKPLWFLGGAALGGLVGIIVGS